LFLVRSTGCIGNGPVMDLSTIHPRRVMPTIPLCCHLCK
jgi:hypothetical protein